MTSLVSQLKEGHSGKIQGFTDEILAGKLVTMGILPGSQVKVIRRAPFKGGFYLKIDGSNMVMREQEADSIVLDV
jgi:ferrous iron transport protein A